MNATCKRLDLSEEDIRGYMLKHWEKLTLFLSKAGAPLDNNICERALKMAILHRKNSLFYKPITAPVSGTST